MGMGEITENLQAINYKPATQLFSDMNSDNLIQPFGQVDLLIRIQITDIHPIVID